MIDLDTIFDDDREPVTLLRSSRASDGFLLPEELPVEWKELWEERAAIREHEGGQAREHAEAEAFTEILAKMKTFENQN